MKIRPIFAWYDFWVGLYWDQAKRRLYVFPIPCLGVVVQMGESASEAKPFKCRLGWHAWESSSENVAGQLHGPIALVWWTCKHCGKTKLAFIGH